MPDHPTARTRPKRHLFLVSTLTADEVAANSEEASGADAANRSLILLLDGLDALTTTARFYVAEILNRWNLVMLADTAALVVTELVSKATQHARPPFRLTVGMDKTTRPSALEISVTGSDPTLPAGHDPLVLHS